ncbi:MAG: hypothetical protein M3445_08275 [Actinomycetota bacterium]|jgi:hypothetical protein|nr:hypothetical protein [Actinomycetota bacterium]
MQRRTLVCLSTLTALILAGCSEPDRSTASKALADRIVELPGIREVNDSYVPDTFEFNESTDLLALVDVGATAEQACAAVSTFVERFPDTDIASDQSGLEVRDESGDPTWSFTLAAEISDAEAATERCVASWQARAIPLAYAVRVYAESDADLSRPLVLVNFLGEVVRTPEAGLKLARENVADFDEFEWEILNICGEAVCGDR